MADDPPPPELWEPPDGKVSGAPGWDQEEADGLIGQTALVGVTYVKSDGVTVTSEGQYYGKIVAAERDKGISIECEGRWSGHTMTLPPDIRAFHLANRGEYRLRSTGEVVTDPNLVSTWTIHEPSKS